MKLWTTLLTLLICFSEAISQFHLAPVLGANISSFRQQENTFADFTNINQFYAGLHSKLDITNKFSIGFEAHYSQKGTKGDLYPKKPKLDLSSRFPIESKLEYLDFLPGINFRIIDLLSINTGVTFGLELSEKYSEPNGSGTPIVDIYTDPNWGGWLGLTAHLGKLLVNFRYHHGFTQLSEIQLTDLNGEPTGENAQLYDKTFQIGVGYYVF